MSMAIDGIHELDFSAYSSTTTTSIENDRDHVCNWNDWSPAIDWEALSGGPDDFHDLIESILNNEELIQSGMTPETSNSDDSADTMLVEDQEANNGEDFKGLRLVHLLMAAAEALTLSNSLELARVILIRLKELVSPKDGSNMERLAAYFTEGLQGLLEGAGGVHGKHLPSNGPYIYHHRDDQHHMDVLSAFQLLQDMSPYVKFGHFTANQAILEAVVQDVRIHIVDYDIMEGIQWASLMQALASRKDGPPMPHLRITALSRGGSGRRSIGTVQETGRRLIAFAESIGQPFSFHHCRLDPEEKFRPSAVKLVKGEALVMNCMLHLPHFSNRASHSVASFLSEAKTLNPRLITLAEEEVGLTGDGGFVERFMDSLHHYSAVYDSLEEGFPMHSGARALVERVVLGPRIAWSLARMYQACEEDEARRSWREWLGAAGYKPASISFANHCQAKLLLGLFNDGHRVEELGNNRLVLGWKSRRLLSASIWTSPSSDSADL